MVKTKSKSYWMRCQDGTFLVDSRFVFNTKKDLLAWLELTGEKEDFQKETGEEK